MASSEFPDEKCMDSYNYSFDKNIIGGKVAFITGGGSGICFTIAEIFMRHGCRTVIGGRKLDRLKKSAKTLTDATGVKCVPVQVDVRKPAEVIAAVDVCLQEFGRIDILINGAAGNFLCPLESMSFNAFRTVMEIDTLGTYNVSKVVYDKYFKSHGGVIINITATLHYRGTILQAHVGSAKAAIEYLTRHQALEWGPQGVRVLCVAPGAIGDTEGVRRLSGGATQEDINRAIPIRRMGTRQEIGEICLFLVTDMAGLITSSTVIADGAAWLADGSEEKRMEMYRKFMSRM
ncbi:peroxisomal 2,4-dienoyl-CoA reductase [Aplysia californica]|uniref:Peroxisomal 2,4-dienoyl-CoA reductase [(3E)-enoyl-CoA-producing] n=1 Tax=Aplysia californica TaxID=6500 RepID=A0ABM0JTD0_APLCA|nr:peroxisomal 2,4-dienoyl-CoA reductase [Aplysia californica]